MKTSAHLSSNLAAPCGMNCGICKAYLREKNRCPGCAAVSPHKPKHCLVCRIKTCTERRDGSIFCYDCGKYPCRRLKQLDDRYRNKYGMSMLENLGRIQAIGPERFMETETSRWACPACAAPVCVHDKKCYSCGKEYGSKGQ